MKSKSEILARLEKLTLRHLQLYTEKEQRRIHSNCIHNITHIPKKLLYKPENDENSITPRLSNSLVVYNGSVKQVHLCVLDKDDIMICDNFNDAAETCKYFSPIIKTDDVVRDFYLKLSDDKYVMKNYPDIANLQWVINERVYKHKLGFFSSLLYTITKFFINKRPLPKMLTNCVESPKEIPHNIWD